MNERKKQVQYWIKYGFKTVISCAKEGMPYMANYELLKLRGMVQYMNAVGDIDENTWHKLQNLCGLIAVKYNLH